MPRPCFALSILILVAGCQGWPEVKLCGEIPSGGCPLGRGGSCKDATCNALYDCVGGRWTRAETCPGNGTGGGGGGDVADAGADGCAPISLDHTGEVIGCKPDLQEPDCPAVAAEQCAATACLTGCEDFYLCTKDGWQDVAYCNDAGKVDVFQ